MKLFILLPTPELLWCFCCVTHLYVQNFTQQFFMMHKENNMYKCATQGTMS